MAVMPSFIVAAMIVVLAGVARAGDTATMLVQRIMQQSNIMPQPTNLVEELVRMGPPALPAVRRELAGYLKGPTYKPYPGTAWLFYVWARIEGPKAYPDLMAILQDRRLASFGRQVEVALAASRGFDSMRSTRDPLFVIPTDREPFGAVFLPQDALDAFLLAWLKGDLIAFERAISPAALCAANLRAGLWKELQATVPPGLGDEAKPLLFAYRVDLPTELHRDALGGGKADSEKISARVQFYSGESKCATINFSFVDLAERSSPRMTGSRAHYALDNSNLLQLVKAVAPCVSAMPETN
jgi:hypothetical protein